MEMWESVMRSCSCTKEDAVECIDGAVYNAAENMACGDSLYRVTQEALEELGLDADWEIQMAELITACEVRKENEGDFESGVVVPGGYGYDGDGFPLI